jgi:hypothetical protein
MKTNTQPTTSQLQARPANSDASEISLRLTPEEKEVLCPVLDNYLSDLHYEIADTDNRDFKHMLQRRQQLLTEVLKKLHQASAADPGANI